MLADRRPMPTQTLRANSVAAPGTAPVPASAFPGRIALALLLGTALVLRVVYVLEQRANPFFAAPIRDGAYHVEWAKALARGGEPYHPGPFFRAPLYPWFLAACFRLFGEGLLLPRLLQCVLGAGTVL